MLVICRAFLWLLLKKVVECTASVGRFDGRCAARRAARIPRFALDGGTSYEKLAPIAEIFLADPFGNILCALEAGSSIEVSAILTRAKIGFTLGALAFESDLDRRRNDRSAQRAAEYFLKARHLHWTRRFSGL